MAATTLSEVLEDHSAVQPVPKTTIAETMQVQQDQNFDLTAFALSRSQERMVGDSRKAFDLELADGSTDGTSGKVQTMSVTVFASDAQLTTRLDFADKAIAGHDPVSFFQFERRQGSRPRRFHVHFRPPRENCDMRATI